MVEEYSKMDSVNVHVASWNLGGEKPLHALELKPWLLPDNTKRPDIFIIGFQEIIPSGFMRSNKTEQEYWKDQVMKCLITHAKDESYQFVRALDLSGLYTIFVSKKSIQTRIGDIATATYKLPYSDNGSKGANAIKLNIDDTSFVFLNCHLDNGSNQTNAFQRHS